MNVTKLNYLHSHYPSGLRDLEKPPAQISYFGSGDFDSLPVLAIVGSRQSSSMAEAWMRRNLSALASKCIILSGGAMGIDDAAHRLALASKSPTVVVLPSGLDVPYPESWRWRRDEVIQFGGSLLSEYSESTTMKRWHFEQRNRLIAALSDVVLIVEARRRSGTAITARHALSMNRVVACVPWFPGDPRGELCNDLLKAGAELVRDGEDVQALLSSAVVSRGTRMLFRADSTS